jgi:hypothetical protein
VGPHLSRRSFLVGTAALGLATACGSSKKKSIVVQGDKPGDGSLNLLVTSSLLLPGVDQRVGLVLAGKDGGFIKPDGPVQVAVAPDASGKPGPFSPAASEVHADTGAAPAYVRTAYRFPAPGNYWVRTTYGGKAADAAVSVIDPAQSKVPAPGQPLIPTATPTPADHRGVEPICTREPACPWHDPSLDAALGEHRPMAVLFATPRLCQTRTCGPVLDTLLDLRPAYESKVRFLHVEIYADGSGQAQSPPLAPAVKAYNLETEPVLFLAGPDGAVRERIDGLFGKAEADAALTRLLA